MKMKLITMLLGAVLAQNVLADAPQANAAAPVAGIPQTPEQWLNRMTNFTRNASAYRDPKVFVPWSNAVTEPGFYTEMGTQMLEPGNWYRMFGSMMDPRSMNNYMQFSDPNMYMKWMAASMDPNFYTALMTQWADPGKMMRWAMMPMDPKVWGLMMHSMNPNLYMKWMMEPVDPKLWSLMMQPMNPGLYTSWMGNSMNPQTYGAWGTWMNPATYGVPMTGAAAGGGAPASFNFFDPNSWMGMMAPGFGQAAPAAGSAPVTPAPVGTFNFFNPGAWIAPAVQPSVAPAPAPAPAK
jgi:hypothetical protein